MPAPVRHSVNGAAGRVSYLAWAEGGTRTPVALAHPVNTQASVWDQIAPTLSEDGARPVYAVDYRGHGSSDPNGPYTARDYARDLLTILDATGVSSFHFAGGSIGGAVGVQLADLAPGRMRSASFLAAALCIGVDAVAMGEMAAGLRADGVEEWFALHGGGIVGESSVPGVADRLVELASGRDTEQVIEIIEWTFQREDSRSLAAALAHQLPPTQLVAGREDPTCHLDIEEEFARIIGAPLTILEGIGHLPMLEAPQRTAELVLSLIRDSEHPQTTASKE